MSTLQSNNSINSHYIGRATKRLQKEYKKFIESPPENIKVAFPEDLILEWHFLFAGLIGTPFHEGEYHGVLMFPQEYPFSPPSIKFITPNGRFKTDERVCFELSDFHPECWKPAHTVSAVLQGVYNFMMTETTDTVGSLERNENEIKKLAGTSKKFNLEDGTAELFQNENKAELTENSDTDPIPLPINEPDISSQKVQSNSSPDMLESNVSPEEFKPNETIDTLENLGIKKKSKMGLARTSREGGEKVGALTDLFESQPDNAKFPSSENTKLTNSFKSKPSHVTTQPSKSTQTADQLILPDNVFGKVGNSTVSADSISDPSQQSGSNGFNNSKEIQEDNVTSTSEQPEDSEHLVPQHIVKSRKTQTKKTSTNDVLKDKPTAHNNILAPKVNENSKESGKPTLSQGIKIDTNLTREKSCSTTFTLENKYLTSDINLSQNEKLKEIGKKMTEAKILRIIPKDGNYKLKS